jgi:Ca-activated chloride channel family protein
MHVPITDESLPMSPVPIDHILPLRGAACSGLPRSSFVAKIAAIMAVVIAILLAPASTRAQNIQAQDAGAQDAPMRLPVVSSLAEVRAGSLLLRDGERYVEAPRVATDIDITVSGPTSRARVTQIFDNPTKNWVEAVYVNPLPDGGAVDTLKMVIGDRVVVGDIKERSEAKAIYEEAKRIGRKATLFEQERPNIFTNSVANIGPGERVMVQIEYQEPVHRGGNTSSLRVPLVVAPRYNPTPVVQAVDFNGGGWGHATNDSVPDRDRITPPVLDPRVEAPVNPVAITVHLNAGFPLGEIKSHHHAVNVETPAADARVIRLDSKVAPADRDFELTWTPAAGDAPSVGLFREHVGNADYVLALVTPPAVADARKESPPREIVFVIDNSGSMSGTSITQAKASLLFALDRLKPNDRFNVIRFDHTMEALFRDTVAADHENIDRAKRFVSAIEARGGTEMVPPMKAALTDRRGEMSRYLRQVVFLTDGEIGNEQELFDTIAAMRGRSRVFMVGIGSAPNSFLMTRAAEIGRGTFTHIGSVDQVQERTRELIEKLESPAVTGLSSSYSGGAIDATPAPLPDLYRGEPVVIAARLGAPGGMLEIKGMIGDRPWTVTLPVAKAVDGEGLSKLWARRKIMDAETVRRPDRAAAAEADRRILALALEHHLVSRLTSLVAVDATPSRPDGARLTRADLPLNLPAGWEFDKVFGGERGIHGKRPPVIIPEPLERRTDVGQPPEMQVIAAMAAPPAPPASFAAPGTGAQHGHLARQVASVAAATAPAKEAAAGFGERGRSDVAVLPASIAGGIIGSSLGGNAAFAADEVTAFQEQIVIVLESHPDAAEHVWTSPSRKTVHFKPAGTTEDRTFEAEVRRKPEIDSLPRYGVIGATYVTRVESPVYAGFSMDKPEIEHLQPGDKVFVLGRVESDHDWLIVGRNGEAIGYVPAGRMQQEQVGPSAAVQASDTRRPAALSSAGIADRVNIVTRCRSVSYAIDTNGKRVESGALAACKGTQGGWVQVAEGKRADAQSPGPGENPPQLRPGHR